MATAIWVSASLVLRTTRKEIFTFPIFAVGAVLADFLAITLILDITVPKTKMSVSVSKDESDGLTDRPGYEIYLGLGDRSLGLGGRGHPCEESSHHGHVEEMGSGGGCCEESDDQLEHHHGHDQCHRSARKQKEEFWPTVLC